MIVLVTGGAGFIGSNFIYYMLKTHLDYCLICLDDLTYAGNIATIKKAMQNPNFRFVKGNITDEKTVNSLMQEEGIDVVVNFAAETHVDRSIQNPGIFLKTNVIGTQVLLDACRKFGVKRFHQVSTDEVYGDLPLDRPDLIFTEKTPLNASSPYSASKAAADLLALSYFKTYGLPVTISRCTNNYGPYHLPEKLIPLVISRALHRETIPVYGTGENIRDWLYVDDHCSAIDLIIHMGKPGEIYNIGGNNERTNLDVVRTILHELNLPETLITFVADRPGHDRRYAVDSTKIRKQLGWSPSISFELGIRKTVEWFCDNREWWENILNNIDIKKTDLDGP